MVLESVILLSTSGPVLRITSVYASWSPPVATGRSTVKVESPRGDSQSTVRPNTVAMSGSWSDSSGKVKKAVFQGGCTRVNATGCACCPQKAVWARGSGFRLSLQLRKGYTRS